ncbi:hypothetical protein DESUT3_28570 [Desulfuromonas versatilis]|uniref:DegT/DnrJ/EryC1/StrS aminotransferase family protein n=1 Tax=Desulfuromonas versatilis TaxID=2802975 RepID=A0ABN6E095_9BACT|nr:DegT/DnrJ/EryC1/StrS family aminotransferase [Desulfuromonas versatilis]BCR05788.1 hypothetical protein DESUT3_28570 [Desulfuromonas versatilis]
MKTAAPWAPAPLRQAPFAPWPCFAQDEVDAASAVLRSGRVNYWTGEEGRKFEQEFAQMVGSRHAIALSNGTVALELALFALGIGPGRGSRCWAPQYGSWSWPCLPWASAREMRW